MKKIILISVIFIAVSSFCFAEEVSEIAIIEKPKEYSVGVHIHPISLIISLTTPFTDSKEYSSLNLYSTIEIPCSPSISFVIRPSLSIDEFDYYKLSQRCVSSSGTNDFILGTDLGVRYYTSNNGKGFYVQGKIGLFRKTEEEYETKYYEITTSSKTFFDADIMVYIGNSIRPKKTNLSIFFDVGIGIGMRATPAFLNPPDHSRFDVNIGIGYCF